MYMYETEYEESRIPKSRVMTKLCLMDQNKRHYIIF